jgi:hypothetical protein
MNNSATASWVYLAHYLAWPAVVLIVVVFYHDSISWLLEKLASRSIKFSVFKVQVELGQLSRSPVDATQLKALAGQLANQSYAVEIAKSIRDAAEKDYLVVDIGSGDETTPGNRWLTSRLFILAAILERIRGLRCLVFVSNAGAKSKFICVATPRNVRWSLGVWFPWLEKAFAIAYGTLATDREDALFQRGLDDSLIDPLIAGFLTPKTGIIKEVQHPPVPGVTPPTLKNKWVKLTRNEGPQITLVTHEHASWIDTALLTEVLAGRLNQAAVIRTKAPPSDTARAIIGSSGTFVALVDEQMMFEGLFDRPKLLDQISGQVAARMAEEMEIKPSRPARRRRKAEV